MAEYLDILDKNGNQTGEKKLRSEVHKHGDWHKTVHIWIINSKGELLIQKRSSSNDAHPDLWDISAAGHISAGDTVINAGLREAKEELGLDLEEKDLEFLFSATRQYVLHGGEFIHNTFHDIFLVKRDLDISKCEIQKEELSAIKYIDYKELEQKITNHDPNFVEHPEEYKKLFKVLHERY